MGQMLRANKLTRLSRFWTYSAMGKVEIKEKRDMAVFLGFKSQCTYEMAFYFALYVML